MADRKPIEVKPYGDFESYAWQKATHAYTSDWLKQSDRKAETIVIKASRQIYGKSAFAKAELGRFALTQPGSINAYVAPKLRLAIKMQKEMARGYAPFIKTTNLKDMEITFTNGSVIRFHSENQGEGLRGFTVTGVMVIDEGAFMRDDTYYELLSPWVTVHRALTIIISSPQFRTGFYYDSFLEGFSKDNMFFKTFDWVTEYRVPIPPEVEDKRTRMPARKWQSEYLGQFLDAEGSVFGQFSECLISVPNKDPKEVYLGLDFGTGAGKDYTVLTGFDEKGDQLFIWSTNDLTPSDQVDEIVKIYKSFDREIETNGLKSIKSIVKWFNVEQNSIGKVYIDLLEQAGVPLDRFTTTNESKRDLVETMQVAIQTKQVGLLNDPAQVQEYSFYESTVNHTTKKITYNAPSGFHDDHVMASLLAWKGFSQTQGIGSYDIVF